MGKRPHACQAPPVTSKFAGRRQPRDLLLAEASAVRAVSLMRLDGTVVRNVSTEPAVVNLHVSPANSLVPTAAVAMMTHSSIDVAKLLAWILPSSSRRRRSSLAAATITTLAVSIHWGDDKVVWSTLRLPPAYGHIWHTMLAFWHDIVRPLLARVRAGEEPRSWPTIVLPAGEHMGSGGEHSFEELELLWSSNATRLRIERAGWVPICIEPVGWRTCCVRAGEPPTADGSGSLSRIALLANFPGKSPDLSRWDDFRRDAWYALGVSAPPTSGHLVWIVAAAGTNGRRIHNEYPLMSSIRRLVQQEQPSWRFSTLHGNGAKLPYRDELRAWASASLVVSLFGSAEHNCRFMANGTTLVEVHGALKANDRFNNEFLYRDVCMQSGVGVRWLPYAENGFRLGLNHSPAEAARHPSFSTAHLHPERFVRFFRRVLRGGDDDAIRAEYAQQLEAHAR